MNERTFNPNAWFEAYRDTFAPVCKAQEEGLKTLERFARFNYAVAGDYLETGLAQAHAAISAKNPAEFIGRGAELGKRLSEKLRGRVEEFVAIADHAQSEAAQASESAARTISQPPPQSQPHQTQPPPSPPPTPRKPGAAATK